MSARSIMNGKRAGLAAALAIAAALFVAAVSVPSDSEASPVSRMTFDIYDQDSLEYGSLVYLSDKFPRSLEPAEWSRSEEGIWYCINSGTSEGRALTYGDTEAPVDIVREDIRGHLGLGDGDGFTVMQVKFFSERGATAEVRIDKDGAVLKIKGSDSDPVSVGGTGVSLSAPMQHVCLYTMGPDCDLAPDTISGTYSVTVGSGASSGTEQKFFSRDHVEVSGKVSDADSKPLSGVTVAYTYQGERSDSGLLRTGSDGGYSLSVPRGSTVSITSVMLEGYTFGTIPQPGTVIGDTEVAPLLANEKTLTVSVSDASNRPVPDAEISAIWLSQTPNADDPSKFDKSVIEGHCQVLSSTLMDGKARISYTVPEGGTYLYIRAVSNSTYSFQTNDGENGILANLPEVGGNAFTASLEGNVCWEPDSDDPSLKAVESSIYVTAKADNGPGLKDILLNAAWYYQKNNGDGTYTISSEPPSAAGMIEGKANAVAPTGEDGRTLVVYKVPTLPAEYSGFLYISYAGASADSPRDAFSFDAAGIGPSETSPVSIPDIVSGKPGCVALSTYEDCSITSSDKAWKCTGTLAGAAPAGTSASISYAASSSTKADLVVPDGTGSFFFYVKEGTTATIAWTEIAGYRFSNDRFTTASAFADMTYSSEVTKAADTFERDVPVECGSYSLKGISAGGKFSVNYSVSGYAYRSNMVSDGEISVFRINGWRDDTVDKVTFRAEGADIVQTADGRFVANYISRVDFVTYASQDDKPDIRNVVPNVSITVMRDGTSYASIVTGSDGRATANLPMDADLQYRYGPYTVTDKVSTAGDPFSGYYGINLYGMVDTDVSVVITAKYVAVSNPVDTLVPSSSDVLPSQAKTAVVGTDVRFEAPGLSGFTFGGWLLDGSIVSEDRLCTLPVTADMDGKTMVATYSADPPSEDRGVDPAILAMGMVAITVAILALAYVLLQVRRP